MIRNYFKIAWRNLFRNKGFSITNILGLIIGITCTMLILAPHVIGAPLALTSMGAIVVVLTLLVAWRVPHIRTLES